MGCMLDMQAFASDFKGNPVDCNDSFQTVADAFRSQPASGPHLSAARAAGTSLASNLCTPLSEPQEVWHFDFRDPPVSSERKQVDLTFTAEGHFSAVRFWYSLDLGSGVHLSTAPGAGTHAQCLAVPGRAPQSSCIVLMRCLIRPVSEVSVGQPVQCRQSSPRSSKCIWLHRSQASRRADGYYPSAAGVKRNMLHTSVAGWLSMTMD